MCTLRRLGLVLLLIGVLLASRRTPDAWPTLAAPSAPPGPARLVNQSQSSLMPAGQQSLNSSTALQPLIYVPALAAPWPISRLSSASNGVEGNADSQFPAISADGGFVAFESAASTLVSGDSNDNWDIFVYDRQSGQLERVSIATNGAEADSLSERPAISEDGRFVAFSSSASNLVSGDTNSVSDIFVRDRQLRLTERVSVTSSGAEVNLGSSNAAISADGRFVAFGSSSNSLVPGDTNICPYNTNCRDIFVHDRLLRRTERVSIATNGVEGNADSLFPAISADGNLVAFQSAASTLVSGDSNGVVDIFVRDRQLGRTERVSVTSSGVQADGASSFSSMSGDGRFVAFESAASNMAPGTSYGVYVHDRHTKQTALLSSTFAQPVLSGDGRFVAVQTFTSNSPVISRHDRQTGQTMQVSLSYNGQHPDQQPFNAAISGDGRFIVFWSAASNLVPGDTNGARDIFLVALP